MDIGEDWPESEDESEMTEEYASEQNPVQIERKTSKVIQITPDQRKSSTGSQVRIIEKIAKSQCSRKFQNVKLRFDFVEI